MAADEWRMCVDWLVRLRILPEDHRATKPDAQIFDLAQTLRDGVLLCHLLNTLSLGSVDARDFNPRPQLSQFLCIKNIRAFLQTCKKTFGVREIDLFEPPDLFDVSNFRKVLHTLSKLSKTELALRKERRGFPVDNELLPEHDYYNSLEELAQGFPPENNYSAQNGEEEDIYGNLEKIALFSDMPDESDAHIRQHEEEKIYEEKIYEDLCSLKRSYGSQKAPSTHIELHHHKTFISANDLADNEELYDTVYHEEDDEIYEDLCSTRRRKRESVASQLPAPKTKRDYCIKEMVDTERNYVDALRMMVQHFIKPLKNVLPPQDKEVMFAHIETLLEIHTGFHSELHRACTSGDAQISEIFVKWKTKFLIYGDYCSNLPKAQEQIEDIMKNKDNMKSQIEDCERKANEGRFRLRDLLHVPMQRVLKYHLLLKELIKNTDKNSEGRKLLETALEEMQDLSLYVNEVKRDNEALQLIHEIQDSIVDLQMPPSTSLKDYGRLQKDGELKVRSHIDNKVRPRYIFLFDKVMLMAKSRGETYSFKEAIVLAEFKVDDSSATRDKDRRADKWNCSFQMVRKDMKMAYTFLAKTDDMKAKWIDGINLALENTSPSAGANYVMTTFSEPKTCDCCGKLLRGVFFQGYYCQDTKKGVHKECIGKSPREKVPSVPPRINHRVKALVDYIGMPAPGLGRSVLKFEKDDIIDVLNSSDSSEWWKGCFRGNEGWFPAHFATEHQENRLQRKGSYLDWKLQQQATSPRSKHSMHVPPAPAPHSPKGPPYVNVPKDSDEWFSEFLKYNWFVGKMPREVAVQQLTNHPNGTFLVRVSENQARKGEFALSIKYANNVRHIRLERNAEGSYYLADTKFFRNVPSLVEWYEQNSLAESFPEVDTPLLYPIKSQTSGAKALSYAVAVYDYAATATTQLSLAKGDRVVVTSKSGSDKGWWKGEHCTTKKIGYFPLAYVREEDEE